MTTSTQSDKPTKSANHITFIGDYEYVLNDGTIYQCPISNVMDVRTGSRTGRFECDLAFALRNRTQFPFGHFCDMIEAKTLESYCLSKA
jgi:hypothetical protein